MIAKFLRPLRPSARHLALGALAALLLLRAALSARWRMEHDAPLLHYVAFLMDAHGRFPYRDVFETSMPGAFAFHLLVVKLFGYGDAAFRLVDLGLLALLVAATYLFMRRFGRAVGLAAAVTFGLIYLGKGPTMSLQRDYVGVIPLACALLCVPADFTRPAGPWRFLTAGLCFGVAAMFKPHLVIGLPVVFAALLAFRWGGAREGWGDGLRCAAACGAGLLLPALAAALWLWSNSAVADFAAMFFNYLPLHVALTGAQEDLPRPEHAFYLVEQTLQFGGYAPLVLCSLFAAYHVLTLEGRPREVSISAAAVFFCALTYVAYPALGGKFWDYHFIPLAYFLVLASSLCLYGPPRRPTGDLLAALRAALPALVFFTAVCVRLNLPDYYASSVRALREGQAGPGPKSGRVDEIAAWLKPRLGPGDAVQPLDWADGAVHAMLLAQAPLATEFLYEYHFYHHTSSPTVRGLRGAFIEQLRRAPPRFIVETRTPKPWVPGGDWGKVFPELRRFVAENYEIAAEGSGYVIYERNVKDAISPNSHSGRK